MSILDKIKELKEEQESLGYILREKAYSGQTKDIKFGKVLKILFGLGLMILGAYLFHYYQHNDSVFFYLSFIFFGIGVFLLASIGFDSAMEEDKRSFSFKKEKWQRDYKWGNKLRVNDDMAEDVNKYKLVSLFLFLLLLFFLVILIFGESGIMLIIVMLLYSVAFFFVLKHTISMIFKYKLYGDSYLVLKDKPIPLGQEMTIYLMNNKLGEFFDHINVNLLFIREIVTISKDSEGNKQTNIKFNKHYEERKQLPMLGNTCEIVFDIPDFVPETHLSSPEAKYWVLDIEAKNNLHEYKTTFLIPVYKSLNML